MQLAKDIITFISERAKQTDYKFKDLHKCLYNPSFYELAIKRDQLNKRGIKKQVTEKEIYSLISTLKNKKYKISDYNKKKYQDRYILEIISLILEKIYEPLIPSEVHSFRYQRSVHTALYDIKARFKGAHWFLYFDLESIIQNCNINYIIECLNKKIQNNTFIGIINQFFIYYWCTYTTKSTFSNTLNSTNLGNVLLNIILLDLDIKIKEVLSKYNYGKRRKGNPEYNYYTDQLIYYSKKIKQHKDVDKNKAIHNNILKKYRFLRINGKIPSIINNDTLFSRANYIRYSNQCLISVTGPYSKAKKIADEITNLIFTLFNIRINCSLEKSTLKQKTRFLNYYINISNNNSKQYVNGKIFVSVPYDIKCKFIYDNKFGKFSNESSFYPLIKKSDVFLTPYEILTSYSNIINPFYNYYKLCNNFSTLNSINNIVERSYLKTLASKFKTSENNIRFNKIHNLKVSVNNKIGLYFNDSFIPLAKYPFKVTKLPDKKSSVDLIRNTRFCYGINSLDNKFSNNVCYICGSNEHIEFHHIRKLKENEKTNLIIARTRKTIPLCINCHKKLHALINKRH